MKRLLLIVVAAAALAVLPVGAAEACPLGKLLKAPARAARVVGGVGKRVGSGLRRVLPPWRG